MRKWIAALFVSLTLAFASLGLTAMPAFADELPTVKVDVNAENGDYGNYTIDDNSIDLLKTDVVYELSGNTERQVVANNSSTPDDEFFHLRLSTVVVGGGITAQSGDDFLLRIEASDGTSNNVETLKALRLYIFGSGSLDAESLDVGPTSPNASTAWESHISVQDTQIEVQRDVNATASCIWTGDAELSGNASVTYVSAGDYASLRVRNVYNFDEAITIEDNAKLYCLQHDKDLPSSTYVDGLQIETGKLLLCDNALLQAEARPLESGPHGEGGIAVYAGSSIEVKDNAQIKASAYGSAVDSGDDMVVSGKGAIVQATSKNGEGITAGSTLTIKEHATVSANGKLEAINAHGAVDVEDANLDLRSGAANAVKSLSSISMVDTTANVSHAPGLAAFTADGGITINGCLIGLPDGGKLGADVKDSIVQVGSECTVYGNVELFYEYTLASGVILTIPAGASLTVPSNYRLEIEEGATLVVEEGAMLINNGTACVLGTVDNAGTIECNSHSGGVATCASRAICGLCKSEYGELDPANHANLTHVAAKDATTTTEGNIEYWFCSGCNKYFADAAAEKEITQASTIVSKLPEQTPANTDSDNDNSNNSNDENAAKAQLAATGDSNNIAFVLAAAFAAIVALSGSLIASKVR